MSAAAKDLFTLALLSLLAAAAAGIVYQILGAARDARRYPAPGRLIEVGRRRAHLRDSGAGSPIVILESGIAASSVSWDAVESSVASFTRVVAYDRPGLAWSDPAPPPRSASRIVEELRALLEAAGVEPPYVLVGHSFGSFVVRLYASRYRAEAAGLVLVDPIDTREWTAMSAEQKRMLWGGVAFSHLGSLLAGVGVVRAALALLAGGRPRIPAAFVRIFGPAVVTVLGRIIGEVRKLPPDLVPVAQSHWCRPRSFRAMADHLAALPLSAAEVEAAGAPAPVPLVVLTAVAPGCEAPPELAALARLSPRGRAEVVEGSGHWIQLDRPERVVASIRAVVEEARAEKSA